MFGDESGEVEIVEVKRRVEVALVEEEVEVGDEKLKKKQKL